jgi:tetratricopeptide (TPR) repeat protein
MIGAIWRVRSSIISKRWRFLRKTCPQLAAGGNTLNNLGTVAARSWRLGGVRSSMYQQALAIYEKLAPNSLEVARTLHNLGNVALDRGDLAAAERYLQQALAIYEKLAPNSLQVAGTLNNLGNVAHDRRRTVAAGVGGAVQVADTLHNHCGSSGRWRFLRNLPPTRCRWQPRSTIWEVWLMIGAI